MNAAEIIEALGDTTKVAVELGTSAPAVSNWKRRGIPRSRLLDIVEAAARAGLNEITSDVVRAAVVHETLVSAP